MDEQVSQKSNGRLPLESESPPLRLDEGGAVRVGKSRITIDLVVEQYENGMTPEEMVLAYDTLVLADVYGALAYYLRHRDEVHAYMSHREKEAAVFQAEIEAQHPRISKDVLIARRSATEKIHAATGQ